MVPTEWLQLLLWHMIFKEPMQIKTSELGSLLGELHFLQVQMLPTQSAQWLLRNGVRISYRFIILTR
jgi:hypothetical protein